MPIQRTAWIDDDGTGTTGTVINNAEKTLLYDQIDAALLDPAIKADTVLARTDTGTVHNWAPGLVGHTLIIWTGTAQLTITGLAGGINGQRVTIKNLGNGSLIWCPYGSASSSPANSLINFAASGATPIALRGMATYCWSAAANRWDLIAHEQGEWITPAFNAADYTASSGMTWTVESADVETCRYLLRGRTLHLELSLLSTSVGGTPDVTLRRVVPGGYSASHRVRGLAGVANDGGVYANLQLEIVTPTRIDFYRNVAGSGAWSPATNSLHLFGVSLTFEVL